MKSGLTLLALGSLFAAVAIAQPPLYHVIDLGTLPGGNFSSANYLNDNRVIGGNAADAKGTQQAVFWWGPFMIDIGTPGLNSGIFGINTSGQAAIAAEIATKDPNNENFGAYGTGLETVTFLYERGLPIQLPTLGGNNSGPGNINSKGEIAGLAENGTRDPNCPSTVAFGGTGPQVLDYEAVVWGPKPGDIRELKPLTGDTVGMALWVNDNSQVVGASGTCANSEPPPLAFGSHAVLWDADGTAHDLGNLGSTALNMALAINNQGQVAGVSAVNDQATPAQGHHAFRWTTTGGMQDLGTLPGDVASVGTGINDAGDVVGVSLDSDGDPSPYLWHNGVMSGLNDLVAGNSSLFLLFSTAINDRGEISGFGVTEKGDVHGFLASPISGTPFARDLVSTGAPLARPVLSDHARKLLQRLPGGFVGTR
jgi:probable HAF family extracellular repeat protein